MTVETSYQLLVDSNLDLNSKRFLFSFYTFCLSPIKIMFLKRVFLYFRVHFSLFIKELLLGIKEIKSRYPNSKN